jgi:hypothetical protein
VVESGQNERDEEEEGRGTRCCCNPAPGLEAGVNEPLWKPGSTVDSSSRALESGFYCLRTVWSLVQETGLL